ncbi:MAG: hypothetical protein MJ175_05470 [Clostridia bacterium]|nr:hypothetical protein [Clostridia bacterium]
MWLLVGLLSLVLIAIKVFGIAGIAAKILSFVLALVMAVFAWEYYKTEREAYHKFLEKHR